MIYSSKARVESELSRNALYVDGIASLLQAIPKVQGWEEPYAKLKTQLTAYDDWVKATILPKARPDFRLPPELYAFSLENVGIDIPPAELAAMAHKAFNEYQAEMQSVAVQIAKQRGWPNSDYRDVIKRLKQDQLVGDSVLPFYQERLKVIEGIIRQTGNLVNLPDRPARIRIGTSAESAQQPAPRIWFRPPLLEQHCWPARRSLALAAQYARWQPLGEEEEGRRLHLRRRLVDADRLKRESQPRAMQTAIPRCSEHGDIDCALALRLQQHQRRRMGALRRVHHEAVHATGRPAVSRCKFRSAAPGDSRAFSDPELASRERVQPADVMKTLTVDRLLSRAVRRCSEVQTLHLPHAGPGRPRISTATPALASCGRTRKARSRRKVRSERSSTTSSSGQGLLPPDLMHKGPAVMEDFLLAKSGAD